MKFLLRVWGLWKLIASLGLLVVRRIYDVAAARPFWRWHDRFVQPAAAEASLDAFASSHGIALLRVADINAADAVAKIAALDLDLAIILGGRILKDALRKTRRLGTLNIHKHRIGHYRGGPEIGYPELLNGDATLGVTVHQAEAEVDAGAVIVVKDVPLQAFDTIESLKLKTDCEAIELYRDAVVRFAGGDQGCKADTLGQVLYSTPWIDR